MKQIKKSIILLSLTALAICLVSASAYASIHSSSNYTLYNPGIVTAGGRAGSSGYSLDNVKIGNAFGGEAQSTNYQLEATIITDAVVVADTTPPIIILTQPDTPANTDITLSYQVSDDVSAPEDITVEGDDSPYTQEGEYSISLTAKDEAGNQATSNTVSFTIDKTPPLIIITLPLDGATVNTSEITLEGTINGEPFSEPRSLTEGSNTITKTTTDTAGNTGSSSITVTYIPYVPDTAPPVITLTQPDTPTNQNITLSYQVSDDVSEPEDITVFGDDSPYIEEGEYSISLIAKDEAGNTAESNTVTFTIDKTAPVIIITSPIDGTRVETSAITLEGTIDGVPFTEERTLPHTGENLITKTAADLAGNISQASIIVIYEALILGINPVTSPTNADIQIITGTKSIYTDEVSVICRTATVGTVSYPTDTSWECTLTALSQGEHIIIVMAKDKYNDEPFLATSRIIVDITAPVLSPDAEVLNKNCIELSFSENVIGADIVSNYSISPPLGTFTINYQGQNRYLLNSDNDFEIGVDYLITAKNITDIAGNPLEAGKNTATFCADHTELLRLIMFVPGLDDYECSVASAGDVNGDGFDDFIVGKTKSSVKGKAYIYLGGPYVDNAADLTITSGTSGDRFGYSVASAGDVNGDGFSDMIVGAYYNNAGKAVILYGSPSMDNITYVVMYGEISDDCFGYSVASAGDVNGDGFSDVIVGAHNNDENGYYSGKAYIYFGGSSMDNVADVAMAGETSGNYFGRSVASAGDVNGDGFSDVIVGAYLNDEYQNNAGKVYIYFGGPSMDNIADITITGEAEDDYFGYSVASTGDINGDGFGDVIVGAHQNDENGSYAGKAYIYFGGSFMDNIADVAMVGKTIYDRFGYSVASAGDVNGDGFSDVIVGAHNNDENGNCAYVYLGGSSMDTVPDETMTNAKTNNHIGQYVTSVGDINADGLDDVACTSRDDDGVYIYGVDNIKPVLLPTAAIIDEKHVEVCYSEQVKGADDIGNYSINPSLGIKEIIAQGDNTYRLTLDSLFPVGIEYTITAVNITDLAGNIIDSAHNEASFTRSENFLPVVDSFLVTDEESGDDRYTNSRNVRVLIEDRGIDGDIIKWLITESSTPPQSSDFVLSERPTSHTIQSSEGLVGLYVWVMDTHNNISALTSDSQSKIILDMTNPTIKSFKVIDNKTLEIEPYEYLKGGDLPENYSIKPSLGGISVSVDYRWGGPYGSSYRIYRITTEEAQIPGQAYTLKISNVTDAALNPFLEDEITFTALFPAVSNFSVADLDSGRNTHTNFNTVSVSMTEISYGPAISKWLISESSSVPAPEDFTITQRPSTYTIQSGEGSVTLYAWIIDEDGNISPQTSNSQHTIILDTTPPSVLPDAVLPDEYSIEITYNEEVLNAITNRNLEMIDDDKIIFASEGISTPSIVIDDDNNIHWAWYNSNYEIWYAKTSKDGTILISPHRKFSAFYGPYLAKSTKDEILWTFKDATYYEIYFAKTDKEGNILINPKKVFHSGSAQAITADFSGDVHWAWYGGEGHNIYYAKTDNTGNVLIDGRIQFGGPNFYECSLATDKDGNINFAFRDVDDDIWYAKLDHEGRTLIQNFKIFTTGATGWFSPSIAVDLANELCWIWRNNDDNKLWFAKTDVNGNIIEDVKSFRDTPSSSYYSPLLAIDRANRLYVAWSGGGNIYWNKISSVDGGIYTITPSLGDLGVLNKQDSVYTIYTEFSWEFNQEYTITIDGVTDLAGNLLEEGEVSFLALLPTVDNFIATDLDSGNSAYTNSPTVNISMSENDIGNDIVKWLITESSTRPDPLDFVLTQRPDTYTIQGGEGTVTLYTWILDEENNVSIATPGSQHTITLDTIRPKIIITSPADGVLVNTPAITLEGTIDGIAFSEPHNLTEGTNTVVKSATDLAGNSSSAQITVTLDTMPPAVIITSPIDGATVNTPNITLQGTVDGVPFQEERTLTEGYNTVTKSVTDAAGNTGSDSITVMLKFQIAIPTTAIISYDDLNRIKSITQYGSTTVYTYDDIGNITNINIEKVDG